MATVQDQFNTRANDSAAGINKAYDASLATQKQGLLDAYNANTQAQTQQGQNVQKAYDTAGYDVGVQNARNARNTTQFADVRGVNSGMGSQHALNLGNAAAKSVGAVDVARQGALQENERQKQLLTMNYNNQVKEALADFDYKKAAALLDDYNNQKKWQDQQAQILASYGNFDPYAQMYGQAAADNMRNVWLAQNPDTAYKTGAIDAETYKNITGRYPNGYKSSSYGGYGWYGDVDEEETDDGVVGPPGSKKGALTPGDYTKMIGGNPALNELKNAKTRGQVDRATTKALQAGVINQSQADAIRQTIH